MESMESKMELHKIDWENIPWEPVREGITRKAFSGSAATLALHKLMPKHEPKPHKHSYEQLVYILAGHIRFHVGDKSVVLVRISHTTKRIGAPNQRKWLCARL